MQTLTSILRLIQKDMYLAKLDIKDAYYSIPIHKESQKLLKFEHEGKVYVFLVLPFGYTEGPRKFTKIMKPPLSKLRKEQVTIADYIDDLITMNVSKQQCCNNVHKTVVLLDSLGFTVHPDKSEFEPKQVLEFLGFVIDTVNMTVALTPKKKAAIIDLCKEVTQKEKITIRTLARLIGKFTSSLIGVPHGRLYYRSTERLKIESLRRSAGNFDVQITLTPTAMGDISWWKNNLWGSIAPIVRGNPQVIISTDASTRGWGASMTPTHTGGEFSSVEQEHHINVLELMAAFFGLQALCNHTANATILLKMDNTSAVACVNKMGSVKSIPMDKITHSIWEWAISKNNWIVATHLPGILNVEADRESRQQETRTEWMLNKSTFRYALKELDFRPETDLFASRINKQLPAFFSYRPDPDCIGVNSFTEDWHNISFYAFPPFACLPQVIQKIHSDKAVGILVVPDWPNQPWFTRYSELIIKEILVLPRMDLLLLPQQPSVLHPLHPNLSLRIAIVSGRQ